MDYHRCGIRALSLPGGINNGHLALFDLDDTLIDGDSDRLWGRFLAARGYGPASLQEEHDRYHRLYQEGKLDIGDFLKFQLGTLAGQSMQQLQCWREEYLAEWIQPRLLPAAARLIEQHRTAGHHLLIITATNRFLTEPIAALYGISELLATELEIIDGCYSGQVAGLPCFAEGKVRRILEWLNGRTEVLRNTWFYTDSHNDLPLLCKVGRPVAVDPDDRLQEAATRRGWPIISLRGTAPGGYLETIPT